MEIVLNRKGQSNGICPLYFDGSCNYYTELPLPNDKINMDKVYALLQNTRSNNKTFFTYSKDKKETNKLQISKLFSKFAALFINLNKRK